MNEHTDNHTRTTDTDEQTNEQINTQSIQILINGLLLIENNIIINNNNLQFNLLLKEITNIIKLLLLINNNNNNNNILNENNNYLNLINKNKLNKNTNKYSLIIILIKKIEINYQKIIKNIIIHKTLLFQLLNNYIKICFETINSLNLIIINNNNNNNKSKFNEKSLNYLQLIINLNELLENNDYSLQFMAILSELVIVCLYVCLSVCLFTLYCLIRFH